MNTAPQELLKEYVKSRQFNSTVELDEELEQERCQQVGASDTAHNYRNGYPRKMVKTQLGEVEIKVPRNRNGTFEPKLIGKYSRNADGI